MICPICNNKEEIDGNIAKLYTVVVSDNKNESKNFEMRQCSECDIVYLNPMPKNEYLASFYEKGYHRVKESFLNETISRFNRKLAVSEIKKIKSDGKVLDIGCGRGMFLKSMQEAGYEVCGIEPSGDGSKIARDIAKLKISNCRLDEFECCDNSFDIVMLWHVLEHMSSPAESLEQIKKIIKPDGILIVEVPNFSSIESRFFNRYWQHLDVPRHMFFYNKKSLEKFLNLKGYEIIKVSTETYSCMILTPFKSYMLMFKGKNFLKKIFLICLFPAILILLFLKILPIVNFRSFIRIYAKPI